MVSETGWVAKSGLNEEVWHMNRHPWQLGSRVMWLNATFVGVSAEPKTTSEVRCLATSPNEQDCVQIQDQFACVLPTVWKV